MAALLTNILWSPISVNSWSGNQKCSCQATVHKVHKEGSVRMHSAALHCLRASISSDGTLQPDSSASDPMRFRIFSICTKKWDAPTGGGGVGGTTFQTWTKNVLCSTQKYEGRPGATCYDLSRPGDDHDTTLARLSKDCLMLFQYYWVKAFVSSAHG